MQEHKDHKNLVEQGFTLIELLVVIAILGILAAVVVFSVNGITNRGHNAACTTEVSTVQTAIEAFYAKNGVYPSGTDTAALNGDIGPGNLTGDKFLNSDLGTGSPSVDAGFSYKGAGVYDGGTCPT